ncbi:MAG: radical SAM protein [Kiritimatiellia bacterium]
MSFVSVTSLSRLTPGASGPGAFRSNIGKSAFHFSFNGRDYIHAPATGTFVKLSGEMLKILKAFDGKSTPPHCGGADFTQLLKILAAAGVLEAEGRSTKATPVIPEIIPTFAVLPATSCQLKCIYCYSASCAPGRGIFVDRKVFDRYIEECLAKFFPVASKANLLLHGGGEPTLDRELFKYLVTEFENRCGNVWMEPGFFMTSNGMFTDELCDFIIEHKIRCQISLDGPEDIHDAQRPARSGEPGYRRVEKNIKRLAAGGIEVSIRSTVTSASVSRMADTVDLARELGAGLVHFSRLKNTGRAHSSGIAGPDNREYEEGFAEAFERSLSHEIAIKAEGTYCVRTNGRNIYCGACGSNMILSSAGYLTACTEVQDPSEPGADCFIIGRVDPNDENSLMENGQRFALARRTSDSMNGCTDCFLKYSCAGECPAMILNLTGDLYGHSDEVCDAVKRMNARVIETLCDRSRGPVRLVSGELVEPFKHEYRSE